jgi:hypothetical protein
VSAELGQVLRAVLAVRRTGGAVPLAPVYPSSATEGKLLASGVVGLPPVAATAAVPPTSPEHELAAKLAPTWPHVRLATAYGQALPRLWEYGVHVAGFTPLHIVGDKPLSGRA